MSENTPAQPKKASLLDLITATSAIIAALTGLGAIYANFIMNQQNKTFERQSQILNRFVATANEILKFGSFGDDPQRERNFVMLPLEDRRYIHTLTYRDLIRGQERILDVLVSTEAAFGPGQFISELRSNFQNCYRSMTNIIPPADGRSASIYIDSAAGSRRNAVSDDFDAAFQKCFENRDQLRSQLSTFRTNAAAALAAGRPLLPSP